MDTLNEDLKPFIDERINHNISYVKKSKQWKKTNSKLEVVYNDILGNLSSINQEKLADLYTLFLDLKQEEEYQIYKIAFNDGVALKEQLGISKNS